MNDASLVSALAFGGENLELGEEIIPVVLQCHHRVSVSVSRMGAIGRVDRVNRISRVTKVSRLSNWVRLSKGYVSHRAVTKMAARVIMIIGKGS
jgi:hypothetical protein